MPKKAKQIICKSCGESWHPKDHPTTKEWTKLAPLPDSEGRLTIMIMATWSCPSCGKSVMGLKGKFKDEEPSGPSKKEQIIQLVEKVTDKITLSEIASYTSLSEQNVEKALTAFINQKIIKGKIKEGCFYKD